MSDIIIEVDLDNEDYKKSLDETVKASEKGSKKIAESLDKNISDTLNDSVKKSIEKTSKSFTERLGSIINLVGSLSVTLIGVGGSIDAIRGVGKAFTAMVGTLKSVKGLLSSVGGVVFKSGGLFGRASALSATAAGLLAVSSLLSEVDNKFAKVASNLTRIGAIIIGGLGAAIGFAIIQVSEFANVLGTKFVAFFNDSATAFNQNEKSIQVFSAAIDSVNRSMEISIGTNESWTKTVNKVSDTFNLLEKNVRKAAQEIILVGPKLGLVEDQMKKLLKVSAEYAKINGKEVFQTTVNFVNALNGNAQAVQALGVKLGQTSLQQFAYTQGITKSIQKLTEGEKVQLRFNKLLKQYKEVAGIGAIAAGTLADQQLRLENNQKRLTSALGEGARIIEQNNLLALGFNTVLNNINSTVFKAAGFLGALGARFLQIGGFIVGFTFKIFILVKAIKILSLVLASDLGARAFAANIPLINKSLNTLISSFTKTEVRITSLRSLISAFTLSSKQSFLNLFGTINKEGVKTVTVLGAMSKSFKGLAGSIKKAFITLAPFLIPLLKFIAIGAIVSGAVFAVVKAFQALEEKTGVLTDVWNVAKDALSDGASVFQPLITFAVKTKEVFANLATKGFGILISGIAGLISTLAAIAKRNPFGVFSEKTIKSLTAIETKLDSFRANLSKVGFDISKVSTDISRSIANSANDSTVNLEEIAKIVNKLRDTYENFGLTHAQVLTRQKERQLEALNTFINLNELEGIALKEHLLLKEQLITDFNNRIQIANDDAALKQSANFDSVSKAFKINAKRMKVTAGEVAKTLQNVAVNGFGRAFQSIGKALASGGNAMQAFADTIKATFGELASALGDFYIKRGIAGVAANEPGAGAIIAAGFGLKVLSGILGASSMSSGTAGGGGGSAGGDAGSLPVGGTDLTAVQAERAEPDQILTVNIDNNFQTEESGEAIVNVINSALVKRGVVFRNLGSV